MDLMKPEITINFENHQYEIYFDGKIRYIDFTKSSQIEEVMSEMISEMRNKKLKDLGI